MHYIFAVLHMREGEGGRRKDEGGGRRGKGERGMPIITTKSFPNINVEF